MSRRTMTPLLASIAAAAMLVPSGLAGANPDESGDRISGDDRYETAVAVSAAAYPAPPASGFLFLASGANFADALAGNSLAGLANAPILLSRPDSLPAVTAAELERLSGGADKTVVLLGGPAAIDPSVAGAVSDLGYNTVRLEGADRYGTAAMIAMSFAQFGGAGQLDGKRTAIIANGTTPADALAVGPLAHTFALPLLLTRPDLLPAETVGAIGELDIEQVIIVGGDAAVSASVETQLEDLVGAAPIRLQGANRFQTASAIAGFLATKIGPATEVLLANGADDRFADALAAGSLGRVRGAPILLVADSLPAPTAAFLTSNPAAMNVGKVTAIGGEVVVTAAVLAAAVEAAQQD